MKRKFSHSNKNYRGKLDKQNVKDGRKTLRH